MSDAKERTYVLKRIDQGVYHLDGPNGRTGASGIAAALLGDNASVQITVRPPVKRKVWTFTEAKETRIPEVGEWYISPSGVPAQRRGSEWESCEPILRLEESEIEEVP